MAPGQSNTFTLKVRYWVLDGHDHEANHPAAHRGPQCAADCVNEQNVLGNVSENATGSGTPACVAMATGSEMPTGFLDEVIPPGIGFFYQTLPTLQGRVRATPFPKYLHSQAIEQPYPWSTANCRYWIVALIRDRLVYSYYFPSSIYVASNVLGLASWLHCCSQRDPSTASRPVAPHHAQPPA